MKIVSWNVNGIRAIQKKNFIASIETMSPDVLCLQETKAQQQEVLEALTQLKDYQLISNSADRKGYSGVAILYKVKPLNVTEDMGVITHDAEGRILCAEYPDYYLVNVYVPNSGQQLERLEYRHQWDTDFRKYLEALEHTKPVIVCGDFNVAHRPIDLKNDKANYNKTAGYTQVEIDGMDTLLNSGFIDSFRHLHPETIAYTYWSYRFQARERNAGWRIDYFLVSKSLMNNVTSVDVLSDFHGSDHCPISLEIDN